MKPLNRNKKYEVLLIILFLVFLLFLVSEGLLFVSFFWTSFHSSTKAVSCLSLSFYVSQTAFGILFKRLPHSRRDNSIKRRATGGWLSYRYLVLACLSRFSSKRLQIKSVFKRRLEELKRRLIPETGVFDTREVNSRH